jgi:cytochrome P450
MNADPVLTSSFLFAGAAIASLTMTAHTNARRNLPIPMTLPEMNHPIFGHALLFHNKIEGLGRVCVDNANEHGLSCFYILSQLCMGITRAEDVKAVLQQETFREGGLHTTKLLGARSLILMNKEEWKSHRKIVTKAFKWEHLQEMVSDINSVATELIGVLSRKDGQLFDIWQLMKSTTLEVIGLTAFGYKFNNLSSATGMSSIAEAVEFMNSEYNRRLYESPFNILAHNYTLPTPSNIAFKKAVDLYENKIKELIKIRREHIAAGKATHVDMMSYLLDAHDGDDSGTASVKLNDEDLLGHLATIMGAGFETGSIALTYLFYMMAMHPTVEAKVLSEIYTVLGDDRLPSHEDLKTRLVYCNAVVMEVLRLYPPIPLVGRWTKAPVVLSTTKITVPINTLCLMPIWYINRSPHHFDSPLEFRPERFMEKDDKEIHRYSFIPFSSGARDCVGRRFAMMELVAVFAVVIRKIKFSPKEGYELIPVPTGVGQKPLHGMPLWVATR